MCTVSFYPKGSNYFVGMNRDELLTRGPATFPQRHRTASGWALHPTDAEGGTWIAANDAGISFTLLNWNSPPRTEKRRSRGEVIIDVLEARSPGEAEQHLRALDFMGMRPFRLIGFFPGQVGVREWRWDGAELEMLSFGWEPRHWFSSGLSDEKALRSRSGVTQEAATAANAGSLEWLRRLHSSHLPERGAFSICVHRDDAATLSYTEIEIQAGQITMRYREGSPCLRESFDSEISVARVQHTTSGRERVL